MSRSGYSDDCDGAELGLWRGAVASAIRGKRGQALLRDIAAALDAMPDKSLYPNSFATTDGEFCALGVVGAARGIRTDDLGGEYCDAHEVAERFGIAHALAAEIMYLNDEYIVDEWDWTAVEICGPMRPHWPDWGRHERTVRVYSDRHAAERWRGMRKWVAENLKEQAA